MNYLSKRIRKLNKIKTKKQSTQITNNPDDPEEFCVSIANFNYTIDQQQFIQMVTPELLTKLIGFLNNTQVCGSAMHAIHQVLRISTNFGNQTQVLMHQLGLIVLLTNLKVEQSNILPFLSLSVEIFETWDIQLLQPLYNRLMALLSQVMEEIYSEEILAEALNLFQVLSEMIPDFPFQPYQQAFQKIFISDHPVLRALNFAQQQKLKSLLLITLLNIGYCDQNLALFVDEQLRINIFQELDNIEGQLNKQKIIEEESDIKPDERLINILQIWESSAQSIIQVLLYLSKIYEIDEFEDDDEDFNQQQQQQQQKQQTFTYYKKYPIFFQIEFIQQVEENIIKNYFDFKNLINQKLFIETATFSEQLQNISIVIFNLSTQVLNSLVQIRPLQILDLMTPQIQEIANTQSLELEDQKELFKSYFSLFIRILTKSDNQTIINKIPELFPIQLMETIQFQEGQFHILELMKIRYSSKIQNQLSTIDSATQYLLKLMNQDNFELVAQALDCLFDLFTEEDYNQILVQRDMMNLLKQGHTYLKQRLPQEQQKMGKEDFKFLKLCVVNLQRFIEYKINILK